MSTFKGVVAEFPDIRVDYFRASNDPAAKPPLACFLSHVHSDHLQGLEGAFAGSFIYCSAATKELLIRLERKVNRLNFQKGIIETHDWRYRDKKNLLKTIPLETPTCVEVGHKRLRVTLFDANHCVGAVMFLIEGDGKAVLYTGDIRAEEWWVDWLKRHPVLLPYTSGIRYLDKIYLDTSWGWRGYERFTPKSVGIQDLLRKMIKYPDDTVFHLNTWTFGYEDVWVALAAAFREKIHLSKYHFGLFMSIKQTGHWTNGPYLGGFELGNTTQEAIITTNPDVRIHSCERGLDCPGLDKKNVVYITPIIAYINEKEVTEDGIDFGDLSNNQDFSLYGQIRILLDLLGPMIPPGVRKMIIDASKSRKQTIPLAIRDEDSLRVLSPNDILEILVDASTKHGKQKTDASGDQNWPGTDGIQGANGEILPSWIKFPYSRHSSLEELRNLVGAFRPNDIYPCVADEMSWTEENSIETLYGDLCSGRTFVHDAEMKQLYDVRLNEEDELEQKLQHLEAESQLKPDAHYELTSEPDRYLPSTPQRSTSAAPSEETPRPSPRLPSHPSPDLRGTETQDLENLEREVHLRSEASAPSTPHSRLLPPPRHPPLSSSPPSSNAYHPSPSIQPPATPTHTRAPGGANAFPPPPEAGSSTASESSPSSPALPRILPRERPPLKRQKTDHPETPLAAAITELCSASRVLDRDAIEAAADAALRTNGWWDIELECTQKWSYQLEEEL